MQQWEYLEVYAHVSSGFWGDSLRRSGDLPSMQPEGWKLTFYSVSPILSRPGAEGWELVAVYEADNGAQRLLLKLPK